METFWFSRKLGPRRAIGAVRVGLVPEMEVGITIELGPMKRRAAPALLVALLFGWGAALGLAGGVVRDHVWGGRKGKVISAG